MGKSFILPDLAPLIELRSNASPHWQMIGEAIRQAYPASSSAEDFLARLQDINRELCGFDHRRPFNPEVIASKHEVFAKLYGPMMARMAHVEESPYMQNHFLGRFQGRLVSNIFYWHLVQAAAVLSLAEKVSAPGQATCTYFEIGAGFGSLARIVLLDAERSGSDGVHGCKYVIVDLASSLAASYTHLALCLPELPRAILLPSTIDQCQALLAQPGSALLHCPLDHLDELANLQICPDVAINCGSFQEMPDDIVANYLSLFDRLQSRAIYSLNYFLAAGGLSEADAEQPPRCHPMLMANYDLEWAVINNPVVMTDAWQRNWLEAAMIRTGTMRNPCSMDISSTYQGQVAALLNTRGLNSRAPRSDLEGIIDMVLQLIGARAQTHVTRMNGVGFPLSSTYRLDTVEGDTDLERIRILCHCIPDLAFHFAAAGREPDVGRPRLTGLITAQDA